MFRLLRAANPALPTAGAVVAGSGLGADAPWTHAWPGAALWLFAVLEQANYFHVQLSHGTRADVARLRRSRRLRPSHLARDLARERARTAP